MDKLVNLVLDFLEIPDEKRSKYYDICQILAERKGGTVKIFHKHAFFFKAYQDLLNNNLSPEEFLAIGDVTSQQTLFDTDQVSSYDLFTSQSSLLENISKDTMLIVDESVFESLPQNQKAMIKENHLIFCC